MKHKHYEMICAKAGNMDLVLFVRVQNKQNSHMWVETDFSNLCTNPNKAFFACLPQHKEACLHWLNGKDIEERGFYSSDFEKIEIIGASNWHLNHIFMCDSSEFRIKPRKEKRWIGVYGNHVTESHYKSEEACKLFVLDDVSYSAFSREEWQFIEIEVEV